MGEIQFKAHGPRRLPVLSLKSGVGGDDDGSPGAGRKPGNLDFGKSNSDTANVGAGTAQDTRSLTTWANRAGEKIVDTAATLSGGLLAAMLDATRRIPRGESIYI